MRIWLRLSAGLAVVLAMWAGMAFGQGRRACDDPPTMKGSGCASSQRE